MVGFKDNYQGTYYKRLGPDGHQVIEVQALTGAAIQAAVDALPAEGGIVFLPEGTYTISSQITLDNNIKIIGSGHSTILNVSSNNLFYITGTVGTHKSNITICDFKVVMDGTSSYFLDARYTDDITIDSILSTGVNFCISISTGSRLSFIRNKILNATSQNDYILYLTSLNDVLIDNNIIININYSLDVQGANIIISNNIIDTVSDSSCIEGINGTIVIGNVLSNALINGIGNAQKSIIQNNIIKNNTSHGINISTYENNLISGNVIIDNTGHGIYFANSGYNVIENNQIFDNDSGDSDTFDGIYLAGDSDRNLISNNICRSTTGTTKQRYGINISAAECDKNKIIGNILYQNKTGAYNDAGTGTEIDHNQTV